MKGFNVEVNLLQEFISLLHGEKLNESWNMKDVLISNFKSEEKL